MVPNHYDTLGLDPKATQAEIKQAYRRLVKLFHPDRNPAHRDHDQIAQINVAYEVLSDPQHRQSYDWQLHYCSRGQTPHSSRDRHQRTATVQRYRSPHHGLHPDEHFQLWLKRVYDPVNYLLRSILDSLQEQIDDLAADPFDDQLMEEFQAYLEDCRQQLDQAQHAFRSIPNPGTVAGVAAHLYYCLNQVNDGIEELEYFTLNYDEHYLHTGQELFRIAMGLRREAEHAIKTVS